MFNDKDIGLKVGDDLFSLLGEGEVFKSVSYVGIDTFPEEFGILFAKIAWVVVAELLIEANFFKFVINGSNFFEVAGIGYLANQGGGAN